MPTTNDHRHLWLVRVELRPNRALAAEAAGALVHCFVWAPDPDEALLRVREQVRCDGHRLRRITRCQGVVEDDVGLWCEERVCCLDRLRAKLSGQVLYGVFHTWSEDAPELSD